MSIFSFKYPKLKRPLFVILCMPAYTKIGQRFCAAAAVLSARWPGASARLREEAQRSGTAIGQLRGRDARPPLPCYWAACCLRDWRAGWGTVLGVLQAPAAPLPEVLKGERPAELVRVGFLCCFSPSPWLGYSRKGCLGFHGHPGMGADPPCLFQPVVKAVSFQASKQRGASVIPLVVWSWQRQLESQDRVQTLSTLLCASPRSVGGTVHAPGGGGVCDSLTPVQCRGGGPRKA